jgi:hypothetical protein
VLAEALDGDAGHRAGEGLFRTGAFVRATRSDARPVVSAR